MDEIVRRLRNKCTQSLQYLKESMPVAGIREADEDEENEEETDVLPDAPVGDEAEPEVDTAAEFDTGEEGADDIGGSSPSPSPSADTGEEDAGAEEPEEVDDTTPEEETPKQEYINPLDNSYAVNYKLGQEVVVAYANGTKSKLKGIIEGYDTEGFYRIKWYNGMTTNGFTDIALADTVDTPNPVLDSKCVCGSEEFVNEGKDVVCDNCGRIRESVLSEDMDPLTLADRERPKGKRMIRSEAHPISTAIKPQIVTEDCGTKKTIQDSIRKAFTKKKVEENTEEDTFSKLKELDGVFWSRANEMVEDIEELGYEVTDHNSEYVTVAGGDDDEELLIPIGGTARTITLDFNRSRKL